MAVLLGKASVQQHQSAERWFQRHCHLDLGGLGVILTGMHVV